MFPTVTITNPMAGAQLKCPFKVCGTSSGNTFSGKTQDRNLHLRLLSTLEVKVTKGTTSYGTITWRFCEGTTDNWEATVDGVPVGTGYKITATIDDGANSASTSVGPISVVQNPPVIVPVACCPDPEVTKAPPLLPLGATGTTTLSGTYTPDDVTEVLVIRQKLVTVFTEQPAPRGGRHIHAECTAGALIRGKGATIDTRNKSWTVDIDTEAETYFNVYLKLRDGTIIPGTTSSLF